MTMKQFKSAIITGPTGAIGMALIEQLLSENFSVLAVCHKNSARINRLPKHKNLSVLECNLDELATLPTFTSQKYDIFYHFAWDGTFGNTRNNIQGQIKNIKYTLEAVEAAHALGCKRFIGAGSQAEYGRVEGKISASTPTFPENGYGIAKLCAGQMSRIRCEQLGIEHIWTRVLSIYGPYDGANTMISSTIQQLLAGEKPALTAGLQEWDYLYSKDAGLAFYLLGKTGHSGKIYCIGSGRATELKNYIYILRDVIDPNLPLGLGEIPYSPLQVMHLEADISDLQQDTGFIPRYSFEKGIQETIEWCKHH